jgi:hypothetical protein
LWQFSDGPPGERGSSVDYVSLEEGLRAHSGAVIFMVVEKARIMTSIKDILDTMDVPESRKDVREVASIRWLIRNVGVQNSANPQYNDLVTQLINLLPDHDRQRNIGLAEVAEGLGQMLARRKKSKDGKRDGPHVKYYNNGQVWCKGTYHNNKKDGPWVNYYRNGQLHREGTFKNGKKDGPWVGYYDNGQLYAEGTYKNGQREGPWVEYHYNGQLESEGTYKDGEQDGPWVSYNDNGRVLDTETFKNGRSVDL